jgi:hypothetical protein
MSIAANSALAPDTVTVSMAARYCGGSRGEVLRSATKCCLIPDQELEALPAFEGVVAPEDRAHNASLSAGEQMELLNMDVQALSELTTRLLEEAASPGKLAVTCAKCSSGASQRSTRGC